MASARVTWCWWRLGEEKLSLGERRQLSSEPPGPRPQRSAAQHSRDGTGRPARGPGHPPTHRPRLPPPRRVPGGPGLCLDHADPPLPHRHVRLHEPAGVSGHQLPGHRQGRRGDLHEGECGARGGAAAAAVAPSARSRRLLCALSAAAGPGPGQPRRQVHAGYLRRAALLHQGNSPLTHYPPPPSAAAPGCPRPPRPRGGAARVRGGGAARPGPAAAAAAACEDGGHFAFVWSREAEGAAEMEEVRGGDGRQRDSPPRRAERGGRPDALRLPGRGSPASRQAEAAAGRAGPAPLAAVRSPRRGSGGRQHPAHSCGASPGSGGRGWHPVTFPGAAAGFGTEVLRAVYPRCEARSSRGAGVPPLLTPSVRCNPRRFSERCPWLHWGRRFPAGLW